MELRFTLAQKQLLHLNQIVNRLHPTKMMINKVDAPRRRIAKSFSDDFIIYLVDDVLKKHFQKLMIFILKKDSS